MRNTIVILLFVFSAISSFAQKYVSETPSLPGEKWYGAFTAKAACGTPFQDIKFQPFEANTRKMDLSIENLGNQAAPFLLSNMGRYIWNDSPFAFEFQEGNLILYSDSVKIDVVAALYCSQKQTFPSFRKNSKSIDVYDAAIQYLD